MAGQIGSEDAQVLLGEPFGEKGHDFFVCDKSRKKKDRSLGRGVFFLEDSGFEATAGGGNEIGSFEIAFRKGQPEACGDKKDSDEGACGFS